MSWGNRTRKYSPGDKLVTLQDIVDANARRQWIFVSHKPQHPSIIMNMSLGTLCRMLQQGSLRYAVRNPSAWYVFNAQYYRGEGYVVQGGEVPMPVMQARTRRAVTALCVKAARQFTGKDVPCNVRVEFTLATERFDRLS